MNPQPRVRLPLRDGCCTVHDGLLFRCSGRGIRTCSINRRCWTRLHACSLACRGEVLPPLRAPPLNLLHRAAHSERTVVLLRHHLQQGGRHNHAWRSAGYSANACDQLQGIVTGIIISIITSGVSAGLRRTMWRRVVWPVAATASPASPTAAPSTTIMEAT